MEFKCIMFLLIFLSLVFMLLLLNNKSLFISFILDKDFFSLSLNLNYYNSLFSMTVIMISFGVYLYSLKYFYFKMEMKYMINLMFFIMSMIVLINSGDLMLMFVGWDGLGISSYFLVSYYSEEVSMFCGMITFLLNRLGDSFVMIFMCMSMANMNILFSSLLPEKIILILLLGLITKSAQLPFGIWLPMAMSAPTPISSLVHSSTLVTAGLYFFMKLNFLMSNSMKLMVVVLGGLTFMFSGILSYLLIDMKKSIALSTLSQLGMIFFSMGLGYYSISFMHLLVHALFKSSLFVCLGFFMLNSLGIQDMTVMSKINSKMMKLNFMLSCFSLMGFMLTMGFMSKEMLLTYFFNNINHTTILMVMYSGCVFTGCYSIKFCLFLFSNFLNLPQMNKNVSKTNFFLVFLMSFVIFSLPIFFFDLFYLDFLIFISFSKKVLFLNILLMSIITMYLFKHSIKSYMIFSSFNFMFFLNLLYNKLVSLFYYLKILAFKIIKMEEYYQINFLSFDLIYHHNKLKLFYLFCIMMMIILFWFFYLLTTKNVFSIYELNQ